MGQATARAVPKSECRQVGRTLNRRQANHAKSTGRIGISGKLSVSSFRRSYADHDSSSLPSNPFLQNHSVANSKDEVPVPSFIHCERQIDSHRRTGLLTRPNHGRVKDPSYRQASVLSLALCRNGLAPVYPSGTPKSFKSLEPARHAVLADREANVTFWI